MKQLLNLFLNKSRLICTLTCTVPERGPLTIQIHGITYKIVYIDDEDRNITTAMIPDVFNCNRPYVVSLYSRDRNISFPGDVFIVLNAVPPNPILSSQMNYSLSWFNHEYIEICLAKRKDEKSEIFGIGIFNYLDLIDKFKWMILFSREYRIPVLWKMFIQVLFKIGYFDVFDFNHFMSIVFDLFFIMFNFDNIRPHDLRKIFLIFIEKIFSMNCWFMIIGGSQIPIRRPPPILIQMFSNPKRYPTVNFVSKGCVGMITHDLQCILVSLQNNGKNVQVNVLGLLCDRSGDDQSPIVDSILDQLFPENSDDGSPQLLFRRKPCRVNMYDIPEGIFRDCRGTLKIVVFKKDNILDFYIDRNGTFERLCQHFFLMLNMLADDNRLAQITNQYTDFSSVDPSMLIKALLVCGFERIFNGTATIDELYRFLFLSDFGVILQQLKCDFEGFLKRLFENCSKEDDKYPTSGLLASSLFRRKDLEDLEKKKRIEGEICSRIEFIQENQFVCELRVIFDLILRQFGGKADLGPEINETFEFLRKLVEFLTVPPHFE